MPLPSAAQLIAFLVDAEDDPAQRHVLYTGWSMFEAARNAALVEDADIDGFADVVQGLVEHALLGFRSKAAGTAELPPGVRWNGARLQEHYDFRTTDRGRADAEPPTRTRACGRSP